MSEEVKQTQDAQTVADATQIQQTKTIDDNLKAEYEKTVKVLKEKLGVNSVDELLAKLQAEEEQKLKEQQKYKELAELKEKEVKEIKRKYQQTVLKAEVVSKASAMGFIDTELVLALASEKAKVDESGQVFIQGKPVEEFLRELANQKPYLLKATGKQGSGSAAETSFVDDVNSFEDLLKDSKKMKEYMEKYPEKYRKLKEEYFKNKLGG